MAFHKAEQFSFPFAGEHQISIFADGNILVSVTTGVKPKNLKEVVRILLQAIDFEDSTVVEDKELI